MKKTLLSFGVAASIVAPISTVHALTVTVPNGFETTEASGGIGLPFNQFERTFQYVFTQSELGLTAGTQITGIAFRADSSSAPNPAFSFTSYDIQLSQSNNAPGSLSGAFSANIGSDVVTVRSGALAIAANTIPTGGSPNAFGLVINFTTPYLYTSGPLLLTVRHTGQGGATFLVDSTPSSGTGVFNNIGGAYTATTSTQAAVGTPIVQFTTVPVPFAFTPLPGLALSWAASKVRRRLQTQDS